jgi:hypothetical protein
MCIYKDGNKANISYAYRLDKDFSSINESLDTLTPPQFLGASRFSIDM